MSKFFIHWAKIVYLFRFTNITKLYIERSKDDKLPPKQKITKDMILEATFQITSESGFDAVNARSLAKNWLLHSANF
jgi:hypothetical protein